MPPKTKAGPQTKQPPAASPASAWSGPQTISIGGKSYNVVQNNGMYGVYNGQDFFPILPAENVSTGTNADTGRKTGGQQTTTVSGVPQTWTTNGNTFSWGPGTMGGSGQGLSGSYQNNGQGGGQTLADYSLQSGYWVPNSFAGMGVAGRSNNIYMDAILGGALVVGGGAAAGTLGGSGAGAGVGAAGGAGAGAAGGTTFDAAAAGSSGQDLFMSTYGGNAGLSAGGPEVSSGLTSGITSSTGSLGPTSSGSSSMSFQNFLRLGANMSSLTKSVGNFLSGGGTTNAKAGAAAADPFASQRGQYQSQLSGLMANPSNVTQTPGYQFNYDQGLQALQRQEAASGNLNSGTADIAAVQYGQNYAMNTFNQYEQMLAQLSGANTGSPGTAGQLLTGGMNASGQAGMGLFSQLLSQNSGGIGSWLGGLFSGSGSGGSGGTAGGLGDWLSSGSGGGAADAGAAFA